MYITQEELAHKFSKSRSYITNMLGLLKLPEATIKPVSGIKAPTWYINTLMNAKEKITLILTGPLTNFALAYRIEPAIIDHIEEIVIMGGSVYGGNILPKAEFNIYHDPDAAKIVFNAKVSVSNKALHIIWNSLNCYIVRKLRIPDYIYLPVIKHPCSLIGSPVVYSYAKVLRLKAGAVLKIIGKRTKFQIALSIYFAISYS